MPERHFCGPTGEIIHFLTVMQQTGSKKHALLAPIAVVSTPLALLLPDQVIALWPALVALTLVFLNKNAPLSLGVSCLSALLLILLVDRLAFLNWFSLEGGLVGTLKSPWHSYALVFTLLLGALSAIIEKSGGLLALFQRGSALTDRNRRRFLNSVMGMGFLCFFDGLANALMLGRVARPVADRLRIPRAYLAYLVDTTSSAVACLAFVSTWIVTQLGYISNHSPLEKAAYLQFLSSLPYNYYCIFGLLIAILSVQYRWLMGPMRRRFQKSNPSPAGGKEVEPERTSPARALVPLFVLLLSLPLVIFWAYSPEQEISFSLRIQKALDASSVPRAFVISSLLALAAAFAVYPRGRLREAPRVACLGAGQLAPALCVLLLAWILGSLFRELGTADVLANLLGGWLPLNALASGVFVLGCLISFVSGSSWGTMGLLMPLVLPLSGAIAAAQGASPEILETIVPAVIGAVFGGAVFGDHCSPYSDTTIVSALATGISTHEHTITQLPYALVAAVAAVSLGFFPVSLGVPAWVALLLGCGLLTAGIQIITRKPRAESAR